MVTAEVRKGLGGPGTFDESSPTPGTLSIQIWTSVMSGMSGKKQNEDHYEQEHGSDSQICELLIWRKSALDSHRSDIVRLSWSRQEDSEAFNSCQYELRVCRYLKLATLI
jgi:hypothetical protein